MKYQDFKLIMFTNFHFFFVLSMLRVGGGGFVDKIMRENYLKKLLLQKVEHCVKILNTRGWFTVISDTRRTFNLSSDVILNYLESFPTLFAL